jgi:hypothetical protein
MNDGKDQGEAWIRATREAVQHIEDFQRQVAKRRKQKKAA